MSEQETKTLRFQPIGYVRSGSSVKFHSPHQPEYGSGETNQIELLPGKQFELALHDLDGFDRIWIISWFDRNKHWRPRVLPPRGPAKRRGVFATRSPHRPNPIGLTCVTLHEISGRTLIVGPIDLVDGTPVLDIKPYLRNVDAFADSSLGWVEALEAEDQLLPAFEVQVTAECRAQLGWLKEEWKIDFTERAFAILGRDPTPHRTRRILKLGPSHFRMACGAWRLYFRVEDKTVVVEEVGKGYSDESLIAEEHAEMVDREAQLAFAATWGNPKTILGGQSPSQDTR